MVNTKRLASMAAVLGLAVVGVTAMPHDAKAWWRGGFGVGIVVPPVVVGPPVYPAPYYYPAPPVVYAPPPPPGAYYPPPHRIWVPPHWEGPNWVGGHWS